MTTQAPATSVRTQIVVDAPIERAFAVFTERFGDFKPPRAQPARRRRSPRRCSSRASAATSTTAASTAASAGGRASSPTSRRTGCVFSWDISPHWQIETDPDKTSEVEVRFIAEAPDRTRVELEHRHIDRHGPGWEAVRDGVDGDQGWPLYLRPLRRPLHGLMSGREGAAGSSAALERHLGQRRVPRQPRRAAAHRGLGPRRPRSAGRSR